MYDSQSDTVFDLNVDYIDALREKVKLMLWTFRFNFVNFVNKYLQRIHKQLLV